VASGESGELTAPGRDPVPVDLGDLFGRYGARVYALAYRMTGNRQDAEDITQETYLQAHRRLESFRGESDVFTWIYAIARNLCYAHYRRATRTSFASLETVLHQAAEVEAPSHRDSWEREDLAEQVRDGCLTGLLRCLSFGQRAAFVLHVLLRFPMSDLAAILGNSEGASKVLVHRARRNLKQFLCNNCSAYDPDNPCHCENLIEFSLRREWIHVPVPGPGLDRRGLAQQASGVRDLVALYSALPGPLAPDDLLGRIEALARPGDTVRPLESAV
jgi:RNA polymerase sigma factor (sigma-70 family)